MQTIIERAKSNLFFLADIDEVVLKGFQLSKFILVQKKQKHEELCQIILQRCSREKHPVICPDVLQALQHAEDYQDPDIFLKKAKLLDVYILMEL